MHLHIPLPEQTNYHISYQYSRPVQHCTLLLTIQLHDRLEKNWKMEGQTFRLITALILPQMKYSSLYTYYLPFFPFTLHTIYLLHSEQIFLSDLSNVRFGRGMCYKFLRQKEFGSN